jgi:hypothetical protein
MLYKNNIRKRININIGETGNAFYYRSEKKNSDKN